MVGARLIAAAAAAAAAGCLGAGAAAGAPAVLVQAPGPAAADALGPSARPVLPPPVVARLERRAGRPLPELRGLYRIASAGRRQAAASARRLDALPGVTASVEPAPAPPPAVCRTEPDGGWPAFDDAAPTPDLSGFQDYREGLEIPDSAAGAGVRVGDVEYEWRRTHEDLADAGLDAPVLRSPPLDPGFQAEDHGTAVLGVLAGDADGAGVTGLAHQATVRPLSPFFEPNRGAYDLPRAIAEAALGLRAGDVLLIEQQTEAGGVFAPVEASVPVRDLIRAIVDAGVVVVEPAGNGDADLAAFDLPWLAGPADPDHSGALMVAAGDSPETGTDLARTPGSNYGARVDLQGYGSGVLSAGYGQGLGPAAPKDRVYTSCFDGTSSASATVAGAVAALQGLAIAATGGPLAPEAARAALVASGQPQAGTIAEPIGPRPQVSAAAALLGPVEPPAGPPTAPAPAVPAPPAARRAEVPSRPAARGAIGRLDRRDGTLIITLRGLAPRAVVFVGGRRARVLRGGRVELDGRRPRRFLLVVSAAPSARAVYSLARFRVTVPARGPVRVARL